MDKDHYVSYLQGKNDEELIASFNKDVSNSGWTGARAAFCHALRQEFIRRGFDFSAIGDETTLSFKNRIRLEGKIIVIDNAS